jgi:Flp pilus assembly protein TadG
MTIEVIILVPILFALIMLIVAGGRLVQRQGQVEAAARDAARAASLERSLGAAQSAAASAVAVTLTGQPCQATDLSGSDFRAGGFVRVTVACDVSYADLGLIGLPGRTTVSGVSVAPLDVFRRSA